MKFRVKVAVIMVWLLAIAFGIGGSLLISMSFSDSLQREKDSAYQTYQITVRALELVNGAEQQQDYSDAVSTLSQLDEQTAWAFLRLSVGDEILFESGDVKNIEFAAAVDPGKNSISSYRAPNGKEYLRLSGLITAEGDIVRLDAATDITELYSVREGQLRVFRRVFAMLVVLGAAASYVITMLLTKQLNRLSKAASELASGNLSYRAKVQSGDEIGLLTEDFNNMASKLEESVDAIREAAEKQEQFMASFAHEMKTPMTSIIGYADLMRSQNLSDDERLDAANYIFSEGRRLESLSLKLLDVIVQKNSKPEFVPTNLSSLIKNLATHLRPTLRKEGIDLQFKSDDGICMLEPDLVKSLIVNLIDNSRKAMDGGGNIYVVGILTDDGCKIQVADNGRGIPEEALAHLTEAFFRVDKSRSRAQGGVGLGLSLCREIAEMHGGEITFQSREGNGTIVTAELKGGRV